MHINTHSHMYGHADTHTTHAHIQPASGLSCWKLSLLAAAASSSALTIPKALAVCTGSSLWQTEPNIIQPAAKFSRVPHLQHFLEFAVFVCCALEHKMNSAAATMQTSWIIAKTHHMQPLAATTHSQCTHVREGVHQHPPRKQDTSTRPLPVVPIMCTFE